MTDTPISARIHQMLHRRSDALKPGDPVPEPLVSTSVFSLPETPETTRTYARFTSPTIEAVEARLADLESAPTLLFPSGMATYTALLMSTLKAGDRVLMLSDGYYAARNLVEDVLLPFEVELETSPAAVISEAPLDGVALVVIETPSNPGLDVIDIAALAKRCHAAGALLAVDNTVCTALLQQPLDLGADVVLCADTKASGGHSDLLMGHISSRDQDLMQRVLTVRNLTGAIPAPFEAWLLLRGLETLEIRLDRMCENARAVLPLLEAAEGVSDVTYPEAHPQMTDQGFLIGATFADAETADRFAKEAGLVAMTSFGGLHSSADRRARWGDEVAPGFLRLSFGVEPTVELVKAIERGLSAL